MKASNGKLLISCVAVGIIGFVTPFNLDDTVLQMVYAFAIFFWFGALGTRIAEMLAERHSSPPTKS